MHLKQNSSYSIKSIRILDLAIEQRLKVKTYSMFSSENTLECVSLYYLYLRAIKNIKLLLLSFLSFDLSACCFPRRRFFGRILVGVRALFYEATWKSSIEIPDVAPNISLSRRTFSSRSQVRARKFRSKFNSLFPRKVCN